MKIAHILVCHSTNPTKAIASIPHRSGAIWYVFLHSANEVVETDVSRLMSERDGNVFPYYVNRGLARSWNEGLHLATEARCDATLLLNDDLFFYPNGYDKFIETIAVARSLSSNLAYVTTLGRETGTSAHAGQVIPQQFACCAILPECVRRVGYFDETFTPAYYEDIDYDRRMRLSGMTEHVHPEVIVEHERSATHRSMSAEAKREADRHFVRNKMYFERKWGEGGRYEVPFDIPGTSLHIPFGTRNAPYRDLAWRIGVPPPQEV